MFPNELEKIKDDLSDFEVVSFDDGTVIVDNTDDLDTDYGKSVVLNITSYFSDSNHYENNIKNSSGFLYTIGKYNIL